MPKGKNYPSMKAIKKPKPKKKPKKTKHLGEVAMRGVVESGMVTGQSGG